MLIKKITIETETNKEVSSTAKPYLKRETKVYFLGILVYVSSITKSFQES